MASLVQIAIGFDTPAIFSSNVTAGNIIIVSQFGTFEMGTASQSGGTATLGSFTKFEGGSGAGGGGSLSWAVVTGSGSLEVAGSDYTYHAIEVSGIDTTDPIHVSDYNSVSGTAITAAITTTAETACFLWFGKWAGGYPGLSSLTSGFAAFATQQGNTNYGMYDESVAAGTINPSLTSSISSDWNVLAVALNLAGGAPSAPQPANIRRRNSLTPIK